MSKGYVGFGSFHSDNVEELLRLPDDVYVSPPLPVDVKEPPLFPHGKPKFGDEFAACYYLDLIKWTFVNHGAFGASLRLALTMSNEWRQHAEAQPLLFYDRELFPHCVASLKAIAAFVHASPTDVVFTPNATTGINSVIRSMKLGPSDTIFVLDIAYGSVKKLAAFVAAQSGARLMTVSVPSSRLKCPGDVVDIVRESLPETGVTLAIFDHITSNTALVLPVAELTAVCKAKGARVLIDGAHALGTMGLDIPSIGADYYVSNLHKWLSGCKGTAILYVRRELQDEIVPAVISHGFGAGFSSGFIWDGCRDYSGVLIVPALLKFWEAVDLPACRSYCRDLLKRACAVLCEAWGTRTMVPLELYGQMALIEIPPAVVNKLLSENVDSDAEDGETPTSLHSKVLQDFLHYYRDVECPVKCLERRLWVRISAAPYNTLHHYRSLADAVLAYLG